RRFLDDLLVASAPRYAGVRADYERVLRQRTALLKSLRGHPGRAGRSGARAYAHVGASREAGPGGTGQDGASRNGTGQDEASQNGTGRDGAPGNVRPSGLAGPAARTLDVWDEPLATAGAELLAARIALTATLRPLVARSYGAVAGAGAVEAGISYRQ